MTSRLSRDVAALTLRDVLRGLLGVIGAVAALVVFAMIPGGVLILLGVKP